MEYVNEFERRLGLGCVNIAQNPGGHRKHLGRELGGGRAVVLFDKPSSRQTTVALWDIAGGRAITSVDVDVGLGMLWDWNDGAEAVAEAIAAVAPERLYEAPEIVGPSPA